VAQALGRRSRRSCESVAASHDVTVATHRVRNWPNKRASFLGGCSGSAGCEDSFRLLVSRLRLAKPAVALIER